MMNSLNYLVAQERSAELRRAAEAGRLGDELAVHGTTRRGRGRGRVRTAVMTLWPWATRTGSPAPREPEARRAQA
jgi:hypothetical protein